MRRRLVYTAYNRPAYFRTVLESWGGVRGFADWKPTVHLEPSDHADEMIAIAVAAGVLVRPNRHRRGVLGNPWHALDRAFNAGADFVVLAEDDVIVSDDILEYFTWASEHCRADTTLAVCASNHTTDPAADEYAALRSNRFCPLVWGTWVEQWTGVLRDTWDHDYGSGTPDAPQSGWDWNINLRVMGERHVIVPAASRSRHIGRVDGTHTTALSFPGSVARTFRPHREMGTYTIR